MYQRPRKSFAELLEMLKSEYESGTHENQIVQMQRDDMEHKLDAQLNEVRSLQQSIYDLERAHLKIKQQYEEEILRLRDQLENSSSSTTQVKRQRTEESSSSSLGQFISTESRIKSNFGFGEQPMRERDRGSPPRLPKVADLGGPRELSKPKLPTPDAAPRSMASSSSNNSQSQMDPAVKVTVDQQHVLDHPSVVCCVRFSNDGKYLATGCNRAALIYHVETGDKLSTITSELSSSAQTQDAYVRSVCFTPDCRYLVASADNKYIKVLDLMSKRVVHTLEGHSLDIYSLDVSPSGRHIISGGGDCKAKLWDIQSRSCQLTFGDDTSGPTNGVTSVVFSPDGSRVALGSLDRFVYLLDVATGSVLERFEAHTDSVYSVAFSPDGQSLVSGSLDQSLRLWDVRSAQCRTVFTGHTDFVLSVTFSRDGDWLLSGSKDRTVKFWDPRYSTTHLMLKGHSNSVISIAHSPNSRCFATGAGDNKARQWRYDVSS